MTVIVEGKYDKIRVENLIENPVVCTDGFCIFNDAKKIEFLKTVCKKTGVLILMDSDRAGFQIRQKLTTILSPNGLVKQAYIPNIFGKEPRKKTPSKEGKLGVEGMPDAILKKFLSTAFHNHQMLNQNNFITKTRLLDDNLIISENSNKRREILCDKLGIPKNLSTNALISVLNSYFSEEEYTNALI